MTNRLCLSTDIADVLCSGMIVFKLERERLPCVAHRDTLYYVKDRYVRCYEFKTHKDNPVISIRRPGSLGAGSSYRALSYNPAEHAILLTGDADGGSFELYQLPKDMSRGETSPVSGSLNKSASQGMTGVCQGSQDRPRSFCCIHCP